MKEPEHVLHTSRKAEEQFFTLQSCPLDSAVNKKKSELKVDNAALQKTARNEPTKEPTDRRTDGPA